MYKFVCEKNTCTGCCVCIDSCVQNAIRIEDHLDRICAVIDETKCIDCGMCSVVCPNLRPVEKKRPTSWNQGWCVLDEARQKSSSGGVATALAEATIREGGVVASCMFSEGQFVFKLVESIGELENFRGSKYVKSNPTGIYKTVKQKLQQGRTVLFTGLPCQVAAVKNFVGPKLMENLMTVDLICHGTPSYELLSYYLKQHGRDLKSVSRIAFRRGNTYGLYLDDVALIHSRVQDKYTLSFQKSLNFTENCYQCRYARLERVGDITLGDSWGSCLPDAEHRRGISLVLCQTEKGSKWIKKAGIHLENVDLEEAVSNNHQLNRPSEKPEKRMGFIEAIKSGKGYDRAVACAYPQICAKLIVKRMIVKVLDILKLQKNQ